MDERSVKLKFINEVTNTNKLKDYEKRLQNIRKLMSNMPTGNQIGNEVKNIGDEAEKTDKKLKNAFDKAKFAAFVVVLKRVTTAMTEMISKSSSYLENINLYQVAFNGAYQEADKFVNKITEMYGLDESWAIRTVGIFRQLANAMGMATEQANELSYLMAQMSIDISSLYNVDIDRASQVLQSALAGQTRPIRSVTGADITMNTLQQTLNQLGIDKAINSLSFAEKRMVIIISLTQQLQQATNDFGRTLESPANQMRILNEQWQRLTRAVGNVFLPLLSKILPYLNAILMVLTEIINAVAALFGYKEENYDYFSGMADSVLDLEEGLDGATESAKKLKQGLRGFDKLNVISTPSAASGAAGVGSGISPDIAKAYDNAYKNYMSKLDNVQMKATKIRDSIMEWLGFTKQIDSKTGDVSFKFDHITGGTLIGGLLIGGALVKAISKVFTAGKNIINLIFGKKGLEVGSKTLFSSLKNLKNLKFKDVIVTLTTKLKVLLPIIGKIAVAIGGVVAAIKGSVDVFKSFSVEENKVTVSAGKMALGFGEVVAGGTAVGALIGGPLGAGIGALSGALIGGVAALIGYNNAYKELANSLLFGNINVSVEEWTEALNASGVAIEDLGSKFSNFKEEISGLDSSFDSSMQQLDLYGIKFGTLSQQITEEGLTNITNSIKEATDSATQMVDTTTDYILTSMSDFFSKGSSLTEEEQTNILKNIYDNGEQQKKEIDDIKKKVIEIYTRAKDEHRDLNEQELRDVQNYLIRLRQLETKEVSYTNNELEFLHKAYNDGSMKLDEESYKNWKTARDNFEKEQKETIASNYDIQKSMLDKALANQIMTQQEYDKATSDLYNQRLNETAELEKKLAEYDQNIYKDLANTYKDIQGETDKTSKNMRTTIENVFKGIGVDKRDIIKQFADAGNAAGEALGDAFKKRKYELQLDFSEVGGGSRMITATPFVTYRADGGFVPPVGNVFVMNEKGPELLAQAGGKSFVANQNQMLGIIRDEISSKTSGINNATIIVQVDSDEVARHTITNLEGMAKANGKPFTIGG